MNATNNALFDSAATNHYLQRNATQYCTEIQSTDGPNVSVANGNTITPHLQAQIQLAPQLSRKGKNAYIFDEFKTGSLISVGQLCDDDCIAIFTKYNVNIMKQNRIIITGLCTDNGLWSMPLSHNIKSSNTTTRHEPTKATTSTTTSTSSSKPQHLPNANGIIRQDKSKRELAAYYAATAFNMSPSTIIRAINKNSLDS